MLCTTYTLGADGSIHDGNTCAFCGSTYEAGQPRGECSLDPEKVRVYTATNTVQVNELLKLGWKVKEVMVRDDVTRNDRPDMLERLYFLMVKEG